VLQDQQDEVGDADDHVVEVDGKAEIEKVGEKGLRGVEEEKASLVS
jgi:hypothetical protein